MSPSTNRNIPSVNFCNVFKLSFETKKRLYRHQSYVSRENEKLEKMFDLRSSFTDSDEDGAKTEVSAKTTDRMYFSDGDFTHVKFSAKTETETIDNTKDFIKTKPSTQAETKIEDSIYTRIKYEYKKMS